jgi:CDP-diacylglycerol---glycerol-3-phosphate 3-phosphatidyltransferase
LDLDKAKQAFRVGVAPVGGFLARRGVTPNQITYLGVFLSFVAGIFIYRCSLGLGFLFFALGGCCDFLDGAVARSGKGTSRLGSFLDSTLDRYAEMFVYVGLMGYFLKRDGQGAALGAAFAMSGSFLVSYARAKAESLGYECTRGLAQRPERLIAIGLGLLLGGKVLPWVVWGVALISHFTAFQRLVAVMGGAQDEGGSGSGPRKR